MAGNGALTVKTARGAVQGAATPHGLVFHGVPYAAPPVGARRFAPPVAAEPWEGVLDATTSRAESYEDPLYLNLWTPATDDGRRPVMVWVAIASGFHGDAFARDGVVLVTCGNRHLAVYQDDLVDGLEGSGNLALLDHAALLEWLHENVERFGGDPDNITVFGESHGGRYTASIATSPRTRQLIRRAIPMSLPRGGMTTLDQAKLRTQKFLAELDVKPGDFDTLGALPFDRIVQALNVAGRGGSPVIDGTVIPADADAVLATGASANVDLMTGCSAEEARYSMFPGQGGANFPTDRANADRVRADIAAWFAATRYSVDDVVKVYAANRPTASEMDVLAAISTDHFRLLSHRLATAQTPHNPHVWMYRFSWRSPVRGGILGAYHWLDTSFAFDMIDDAGGVAGHSDDQFGEPRPYEVAKEYHGAFVRFAATGDPNGGNLPAWPKFDPVKPPIMSFDTECRLLVDPEPDELHLWDDAAL